MTESEQDRLRKVLGDTVSLLCRNSISFQQQLQIQGLLAVTVDTASVVLLQVNDILQKASDGTILTTDLNLTSCKCCCTCNKSANGQNSPAKARRSKSSKGSRINSMETSHESTAGAVHSSSVINLASTDTVLAKSMKQETAEERLANKEATSSEHEKQFDETQRTFVAGVVQDSRPQSMLAPNSESTFVNFAGLPQDMPLGSDAGTTWYQVGTSNVSTSTSVSDVKMDKEPTQLHLHTSVIGPASEQSRVGGEFYDTTQGFGGYSEQEWQQELKRAKKRESMRRYRWKIKTDPNSQRYQHVKQKNKEYRLRYQRKKAAQERSFDLDVSLDSSVDIDSMMQSEEIAPGDTGESSTLASTESSHPLSDKKALRAEKARQYRLAMRNNPALRQKYEETKRKNRERMQRHRQMMSRSQGGGLHHTATYPGPPTLRLRTPSSSPEDARLWQEIHHWQTQPLALAASPLVSQALQSPAQILVPPSPSVTLHIGQHTPTAAVSTAQSVKQ